MFDPDRRLRRAEWMDEDDVDPVELRDSLRFIRRVNRTLGYTRSTLRHLQRFSRNWRRGERIELLDLATGSADIPRAILGWADRAGFDVHITAIDRHARTLDEAQRLGSHRRLHLVQADVFDLPFTPGSFDYVLTAMFLHHLDDDAVVEVLRRMDRLARRGVIVGDLLRDRRAYRWIKTFTFFARPIVRHDAAVSVAQAFTRPEIETRARDAGLQYVRYHHHFGHRFVLAGEKG